MALGKRQVKALRFFASVYDAGWHTYDNTVRREIESLGRWNLLRVSTGTKQAAITASGMLALRQYDARQPSA